MKKYSLIREPMWKEIYGFCKKNDQIMKAAVMWRRGYITITEAVKILVKELQKEYVNL